MASPEVRNLTNEQVGKLEKLVADGAYDDNPAKKQEAIAVLEEYAASVRERGLQKGEEGTVPQRTVSRAVRQSYVEDMEKTVAGMQALPRAAARTNLGVAETIFNASLTAIDIADAALSPFTGEEGTARAGLANARNRVLAAKKGTLAELEMAFLEGYGSADGALQEGVDAVGQFAGEAYPYAFFPATWSTWTRTVFGNAAVGAYGAAGMSAEESDSLLDRWQNITFGGLLSAGAAGLLNAKQGAQQFAARRVAQTMDTDYAKQVMALETEIQRMTGQPEFRFSLGQVTANPFVVGLEVGAAKEVQRAAQVQRLQILRDALKMRADSLRQSGRAPVEIVADLQATASEVMGSMRRLSNENFNAGMENIVRNWDDTAVVKGDTYLRELQATMEDLSNPMRGGSPDKVPAFLKLQERTLQRYITPYRVVPREIRLPSGKTRKVWDVVDQREVDARRLEDLTMVKRFDDERTAHDWSRVGNERDGGLNAEQTRELLNSFKQIIGGDVPVWEGANAGSAQALGRRLKSAFLTELETGVMNQDAANAVRSLRKVYQTDRIMRDEVGRTLLTDLLGNNPQMGHDDLLAMFNNRTRKELNSVRTLLQDTDPELLGNLQARTIERAVEQSRMVYGKQSLGDVDVYQLAKNLSGKEGGPGSLALGLFDDAERVHISRTARALNVLAETHLNLFPEASASIASDVGINVISRSPEFVTRLITRLALTSKGLSRALNDRSARDTFIALSKSKVGSREYQFAAVSLAMLVGEYEAQALRDEKARKAAEERELNMKIAP